MRSMRRPCPHFLVDPANTVPVRCHAADQGPLIPPHPDKIPRLGQVLLGGGDIGDVDISPRPPATSQMT